MKFRCCSAYSFGKYKKSIRVKIEPLFTPGPGQYSPVYQNVHDTEPKWKIGTDSKYKKKVDIVPGPGQYNPPSNTMNGPKYSISFRTKFLDQTVSTCSPGPAMYSPNKTYKNTKYSMGSRPHLAKSSISPGPGNYDIRTEKSLLVPSYKFGSSKKDVLNMSKVKDSSGPGPGNYESKENPMNRSQPKYSFGKECKRTTTSNQTPGPGLYLHKEFIGKEAPKISISRKNNKENKESKNIPGPGHYNINTISNRVKSPSFKIGKEKRNKEIKGENPGPGQYNIENLSKTVTLKNPSWKIGTSKRQPLNLSDCSIPGVGNYDISQKLSNGPQYSIAKKTIIEDTWKKSIPGPGQYNNDTQIILAKSPSYVMGKSAREDIITKMIKEGTPGPGMYDYKSTDNGPKYGFGTEKKDNNSQNTFPGPGQYLIPCSIADVNDYTRESGTFDPNFRYV